MNSLNNKLAVILTSGGMDSSTILAIAANLGLEIAAIHFDYKQRNRIKEHEAFIELSKFYNARYTFVSKLYTLGEIGGSALTDYSIDIPKEIPIENSRIPSTYVPFRNGIMLSIAAAWAEIIKAKSIFIGVVEEDSSGYPDCSEKFIISMGQCINLGRKPESAVNLIAPIIHLKKSQIVKIGESLDLPYEKTWSCYRSGDIHCGECPACKLRRRAFIDAKVPDLTSYLVE